MSVKVKVDISGWDKIKAALTGKSKALNEAIRQGMYQEGEELLGDSILQVPVDTGNLRRTGYVNAVEGDVEIGYTAEYAIYVHEDLSAHHPVGKAKFLEDPLYQRQRGMAGRIAQKARILLKGSK